MDTPLLKTITVPATTVTYNAEEHEDVIRKVRENLGLIGRCANAIKEGLDPVNNETWLEYILKASEEALDQTSRL